jgi:hypothetical protein
MSASTRYTRDIFLVDPNTGSNFTDPLNRFQDTTQKTIANHELKINNLSTELTALSDDYQLVKDELTAKGYIGNSPIGPPLQPAAKFTIMSYNHTTKTKKYKISWKRQLEIVAIFIDVAGNPTDDVPSPLTAGSRTIDVKPTWGPFDQNNKQFPITVKFKNNLEWSVPKILQPFKFYPHLTIDKVERTNDPAIISVTIKDFDKDLEVEWVACFVTFGEPITRKYKSSINYEDFYAADPDDPTGGRRLPIGTAIVPGFFTEYALAEHLVIVGVYEDNGVNDNYAPENACEPSVGKLIPKPYVPPPPLVW